MFADIEFVWIPAGSFLMGNARSAEELAEAYGDRIDYFIPEHPQHAVTITRGFWMGKYEITQAQWRQVIGSNPSYYPDDTRPVEQVPWENGSTGEGVIKYGAQEFLARLNTLGEGDFRLPTEAEWEYACRAGSATEFCYGDDLEQFLDYGWCFTDLLHYESISVGQLLPNAWNLHDMHGNVLEWCQDWFAEDYYAVSPSEDPQGPETGTHRVRRGGAFRSKASLCRSAFRTWNRSTWSTPDTGFRICRNAG